MEENDIRRALNREYAPKPDTKAAWQRLSNELGLEPAVPVVPMSQQKPGRARIISMMVGIAAAAAIAVFLIINLRNQSAAQDADYMFTASNAPQEVTLTTADGRQLSVSESHTTVVTRNQSAKTRMLTLSTPRGKDHQVTLSDGTSVWLNADSHLEFPESFVGKERRVRLQGEAYFEVAKDAAHPFIVETDYFSTTVLGTTFNLSAYAGQSANVVLIEGSVSVRANGQTESVQITPGTQATLSSTQSSFRITEVDTYPYTQWREGFFYFDDATLFEVMQALGRWYNVNIAFDDPAKMNIRLHFVAKRGNDVAEAVRNLDALDVVDAAFDEGVITIK